MYNEIVDWMRLGNKITRMRIARNMTQFQLAERTGLSEVYIGYIEQGKRRAALDTYIKIVNVLGYTLDDLTSDYLTNKDLFSMDMKELLEDCKDNERWMILQLLKNLLALLHSRSTEA